MPHSSWTGSGRTATRRRTAGAIGTVLAIGGILAAGPGAHAVSGDHKEAGKPGQSEPVMRNLTPKVRAQLDRAVTDVLRTTNTPGVTVGLWAPGKGSYVRAFGTADKATNAPMSPRFNMRIGSVTKTFTVTALLRLVDQKRLRLDDPVSQYVPGVPQGNRITLRHLAEMRSGLAEFMHDPDFGKAFLADPHRQFSRAELLAYSFKHPVGFTPGSKFQYSNTNTHLLAMVVEKVTGQRFDDHVARHVVRAARLKDTFMPEGAEFPAPRAHGYTDQTADGSVADATDWSPSAGGPSGAMISDLDDLRSWASTLAKGTLLSAATQAERMKTKPAGPEGVGYGLGLFDNHGWIGHNGSLPGYQTVMVHLPRAKATLVVHTTSDIAYKGESLSTKFAEAVTRTVTPKNVYDIKAP
ncbi:serine hydrolase domain-containing protein [Streptomyces cadmiisoli]|uniref:Serine hydrolase n=1 Tax=Streptomyces cadmiisoli TaxID=2184053 RepID=A0A2Z4IU20_9ACTN|nr:serine hydrolase domain-containing protein [Streptomyces cadmiisoli]AWW35733.1 serine hydrolase [Streptomyces cadmiisoli]